MREPTINFNEYFTTSMIDLKGGVNENVSSLELLGGELIDCKNYMMAEGGYGGYISVAGYERIDGEYIPSEYRSVILRLNNVDQEFPVDTVVTGASGFECTTLEIPTILSGTYVGGDAVVEFQALINNEVDTTSDEVVTPSGTISRVTYLAGGNSDSHLALDLVRTVVREVPGEGSLKGLHIFNNKVYAFRKKVGFPEIGMYVEDATNGWAEIDTSADILDNGDTEFNFVNYNFYATTDSYSMFWTDGVNQARMYDGTVVSTIDNTGMSVQGIDAPINITAHNYHLFLAYKGGSLQFSGLGDPMVWDGVLGASEIGLGNEITNLVPGVSSSLIIFLEEGIRVLQGNSIDDFTLETYSDTSGAFERTAKRLLGTSFFVDDRGLSTLTAVQEYGDYASNSISQKFKRTLLSNKHTISDTVVSRDLNQYRIFFDDNTAIYVSFEGKELQGATFIEYPICVHKSAHGEDSEKRDLIVFSDDDESGYIYKMDSGTSFDGVPIICRMSTAYYHYNSPRRYKAFKRATVEISGEKGQLFDLKCNFDYNELGAKESIWYAPTIYSAQGGTTWGSGIWGEMVYGPSAVTNRVPVYLQGIGTNMSYKIISNETYRSQHIIQNIITDFSLIGRRI